jgi:hypothetical protein
MTKGTPHQLFIAESTHARLTQPSSDLVYVDEFDIRGRQARIRVWSLVERGQSPARAEQAQDSASEAGDWQSGGASIE